MAVVPFGEYAPDIASLDHPGLIEAKNTIPFGGYYHHVASPVAYSNAVNGRALGLFSAKSDAGISYAYTGTGGRLYRMSAATWNASTASYSCTASTGDVENWEFVKWGNRVLATNYNDPIQTITMGLSDFASLSACPIRARHFDVVRDFVVCGNVTDISGTAAPTRVHWSGFNNVNTWSSSIATQADYQDLQGNGGWIQKIVGGEFGLVFQEHSIWRMSYVGPPLIFQFDEIEPGYGTPCPNSIAKKGLVVFYLGQDGFYMWNGKSVDIGNGKVYKTFIADYNASYPNSVWASIDAEKPIVYWAYPSNASLTGICDKILAYNYVMNKWAGPIELNLEVMGPFVSPGYTLDDLDALGYTMDTLPASLDSRAWMGGTVNNCIIGTDHKLYLLSGTGLTARLTTGEKQLAEGRRALVTRVRPLVDSNSSSFSLALSGRDKLSDNKVWESYLDLSEGEFDTIHETRYVGFRLDITGDFTSAQGLEVDAALGGIY